LNPVVVTNESKLFKTKVKVKKKQKVLLSVFF